MDALGRRNGEKNKENICRYWLTQPHKGPGKKEGNLLGVALCPPLPPSSRGPAANAVLSQHLGPAHCSAPRPGRIQQNIYPKHKTNPGLKHHRVRYPRHSLTSPEVHRLITHESIY